MKKAFWAILLSIAAVTTALILCISAQDEDFYLGDHKELVRSFSGLEDKLGYNTAHTGDVITIGGVTFDKGFGIHCNPQGQETYIEIDISGQDYSFFSAYVGMQNDSKDGVFLDWGSASFHVYGDGQLLASSDVCKYGDKPVLLSCTVKGVTTLRLVVDCVDGHSCDWSEWADAKLTNTKPEESDTPETTFTPDKTDQRTPDEIISGKYTYASDMYWKDSISLTNNQIMRDANTANEWIFDSTMRIFEKGLGMHASSDGYTSYVEIDITGMGFKKFASYYGVCSTTSAFDISMASVKFAVYGDGTLLFESDVMKYNDPFAYMECDISGVSALKIAVAGAPSISGAWGTWGGAVLIKDGDGHEILDADPATTDEPEQTTAEPAQTTAEPEQTTAEPEQTTTQPEQLSTSVDTVSNPAETTTNGTDAATTATAATSGTAGTDAETASDERKTGCGSAVCGILAVFVLAAIPLTAAKKKETHNED